MTSQKPVRLLTPKDAADFLAVMASLKTPQHFAIRLKTRFGKKQASV